MAFKFEMITSGKDTRLELSGSLDENSQLPEFKENLPGKLVISLKDLVEINSLGCRRWVQWFKHVHADGGVAMEHCSPAIVNQINFLVGFLPKHVDVVSFYVPYHCPDCNSERDILFVKGTDYGDAGEVILRDDLPCPKCGGVMALDTIKDRYFKFLKR